MMARDSKGGASQRKPSKRKFFKMSFNYRAPPVGLILENLDVLRDPRSLVLMAPPGRGFPAYPEAPRFLFHRKNRHRLPRDLELYHDYWLVSDRAKEVFQAVDANGFAFAPCDVRLAKGEYEGPAYWLCDVTRVLDALDEQLSRLTIAVDDNPASRLFGKKYYGIGGGADLVFRDDAIGDAHVFRMAFMPSTRICDQSLRDACKEAALEGIRFTDVSKL